jgi:hypothetical protein
VRQVRGVVLHCCKDSCGDRSPERIPVSGSGGRNKREIVRKKETGEIMVPFGSRI